MFVELPTPQPTTTIQQVHTHVTQTPVEDGNLGTSSVQLA